MTSIADFIKLPKIDTHNHLDLGMRYSSYVPWAGFYIPDFPSTKCADEEVLFSDVHPYTHARNRTEKDVLDILNLSLTEAVSDGVTVVEGTVDLGLMQRCSGINGFAEVITKTIQKFKDRIAFNPVLGINSEDSNRLSEKWMLQLLRTGLFTGVDLYGKDVQLHPEDHAELFKIADNFGLKKKVHGEYCTDPKQLLTLVKTLSPDEIQQGTSASKDKEVMKYLYENEITMNLCPQMCIKTGVLKAYGECPIKRLADAHVHVTLCTDSLLVFNKSISEQCMELCNAGLFTKDEMIELITPADK